MANKNSLVLTPAQQNRCLISRNDVQLKKQKIVLKTPFNCEWPKIEKETEKLLIVKLLSLIDIMKTSNVLNKASESEAETVKKSLSKLLHNFRNQMTVGVSSTTRALEKDQLQLVIVNRSAPPMLHRHILQLCGVRLCPAVALSQLESAVGPHLAVSRVAAFGFKKSSCELNIPRNLLKEIITLCPPLELPWLTGVGEESLGNNTSVETPIDDDDSNSLTNNQILDDSELEDVPCAVPSNQECNQQISVDYSYLYVLKSDKSPQILQTVDSSNNFGADFISFNNLSKSGQESEDKNDVKSIAIKRKQDFSSIVDQKSSSEVEFKVNKQEYVAASVLKVTPNGDRRKKNKRYYKK